MKPLRTRTEERNRILNYQLDDNNPFSPAFPLALDSLILSLTPSMKTERVKHPIPNCPYVALQNNLTESYLCKEFLASCPCIGLSFLPHQTRGTAGRENMRCSPSTCTLEARSLDSCCSSDSQIRALRDAPWGAGLLGPSSPPPFL